jgi:hypothetical protein
MKQHYILACLLLCSASLFSQKESAIGFSAQFGTFALPKTQSEKPFENYTNTLKIAAGATVGENFYWRKFFTNHLGFSVGMGAYLSKFSIDYRSVYAYEAYTYTHGMNVNALEYGLNAPIKAHFRLSSNLPSFQLGITPSYNLQTRGQLTMVDDNQGFQEFCVYVPYGIVPSEKRFQMLYTAAIQQRWKNGISFGIEYATAAQNNKMSNIPTDWGNYIVSEEANSTKRYPAYMHSLTFFVAKDIRNFGTIK